MKPFPPTIVVTNRCGCTRSTTSVADTFDLFNRMDSKQNASQNMQLDSDPEETSNAATVTDVRRYYMFEIGTGHLVPFS